MPETQELTQPTKKPITYGRVHTGYPCLVAMSSTMQPILGFPTIRLGPQRVISRTKKIHLLVGDRLAKLRDLGWDAGLRRGPFIYRCPPPYVAVHPVKKPCRVRDFCPNCWARRAMGAWKVLDDSFFLDPRTRPLDTSAARPSSGDRGRAVRLRKGPAPSQADRLPRNTDYDLVINRQGWVVSHLIDVNRPDGSTVRELGVKYWLRRRTKGGVKDPLSRKVTANILLSHARPSGQPWGLLESINMHPHEGDDAPGGWDILATQLVLVPRGMPVPLLDGIASSISATSFQKRIESPTRRLVALSVAQAFSYPKFLLDPAVSTELVLQSLELRQNARLMETMGIFRARGEP